MLVKWLPLRDAKRFCKSHHRHCKPPVGGIVALGCWVEGELVGIVVVARSNARMDGKNVCEITRLATNGHPNACSKLYSKAKRLAQALGFTKIKTFTLPRESGASLFAVGAELDGETDGGQWGREGRPRETDNPGVKLRWKL